LVTRKLLPLCYGSNTQVSEICFYYICLSGSLSFSFSLSLSHTHTHTLTHSLTHTHTHTHTHARAYTQRLNFGLVQCASVCCGVLCVCCFVLLTRYREIVMVPGSFLFRGPGVARSSPSTLTTSLAKPVPSSASSNGPTTTTLKTSGLCPGGSVVWAGPKFVRPHWREL